jgi:hypothetical protein
MISIKLCKNSDGFLDFDSSNNGRLVDITNENRSKPINRKDLITCGFEINRNVFISRNPLIMTLTKQEDKSVDALYINYKKRHIIIIGSEKDYEIKWVNEIKE